MGNKSPLIQKPEKTRVKTRKAKNNKDADDDEEFRVEKIKVLDGRKYPKRRVDVKNYQETDEPADDRYVYCDFCDEVFLDNCEKCGQLSYLRDVEVPMGAEDRARLTLPKNNLIVLPSPIHGFGVFARVHLKRGIKMGPYEGKISKVESTEGYSWKLRDGKLVDAADEKFSNWMRYVNCARHYEEQNVVAFQYKGNLYYRTCRDVYPGKELLVYYGESFAKNLGIDVRNYFNPRVEHMVDSPKSCPHCCYAYKDLLKLTYHIGICKSNPKNKQIVPEKVFNCSFCPAAISDEQEHKKHEMYCQKKWTNEGMTIERTKRRNGMPNVGYKCEKCYYSTKNKIHFEQHKRTHEKYFLFLCKMCKKGFNQYILLQRHMINHLAVAKDKTVLESTNVHNGAATKKIMQMDFAGERMIITLYECERCQYETSVSSNIKRHLATHSKKIVFSCDICTFFCPELEIFEEHMKKIHDSVCESCKEEEKNCKFHIKYAYTDDIGFLCGICGLRFSQKIHLKGHLKVVHLKEKNYKCQKCSYSSSTKSKLNIHEENKHLGEGKEKKYKCNFCNYSINHKGDLNKHLNAKHIKSIKYECSLCDYFSYYHQNFRRHFSKTHAATTQYKNLSDSGL